LNNGHNNNNINDNKYSNQAAETHPVRDFFLKVVKPNGNKVITEADKIQMCLKPLGIEHRGRK